jgi:hypothetical protein
MPEEQMRFSLNKEHAIAVTLLECCELKLATWSRSVTSHTVREPSFEPLIKCDFLSGENRTHLNPGVLPLSEKLAICSCVETSWIMISPALEQDATRLSKLFQLTQFTWLKWPFNVLATAFFFRSHILTWYCRRNLPFHPIRRSLWTNCWKLFLMIR